MKKILALVLAVMLVVGMTPAVLAAPDYGYGIVGLGTNNVSIGHSDSDGVYISWGTTSDTPATTYYGDVRVGENGETTSGKTAYFYLYSMEEVKDANGKVTGYRYDPITRYDVRNDKLSVQKQNTLQGSKVIKNVKISYDGTGDNAPARVEVEYYDYLVSTGSIDYGFTVYLMKDKTRIHGWKYEGTFKNYDQKVDATFDYIYSYDYPVLDCTEYIKATKIETGNGIVINAKLFEGKKYYAKSTASIKGEDDGVLSDYPDIDTIYYLDQINLGGSGNTVSLTSNDKSLYIYNADLEFIGMGNQQLPMSKKYYVSSVELDVDDAADVEAPEGPSEAGNPNMGGDDVPANVNDNPGTGR